MKKRKPKKKKPVEAKNGRLQLKDERVVDYGVCTGDQKSWLMPWPVSKRKPGGFARSKFFHRLGTEGKAKQLADSSGGKIVIREKVTSYSFPK